MKQKNAPPLRISLGSVPDAPSHTLTHVILSTGHSITITAEKHCMLEAGSHEATVRNANPVSWFHAHYSYANWSVRAHLSWKEKLFVGNLFVKQSMFPCKKELSEVKAPRPWTISWRLMGLITMKTCLSEVKVDGTTMCGNLIMIMNAIFRPAIQCLLRCLHIS